MILISLSCLPQMVITHAQVDFRQISVIIPADKSSAFCRRGQLKRRLIPKYRFLPLLPLLEVPSQPKAGLPAGAPYRKLPVSAFRPLFLLPQRLEAFRQVYAGLYFIFCPALPFQECFQRLLSLPNTFREPLTPFHNKTGFSRQRLPPLFPSSHKSADSVPDLSALPSGG